MSRQNRKAATAMMPFWRGGPLDAHTGTTRNPLMLTGSNVVIGASVAAVAVVLALGLVNMMRGGSANRSQLLMRWRVGLQFIAIIVLMTIVYVSGR